jgi:hypothetical protein
MGFKARGSLIKRIKAYNELLIFGDLFEWNVPFILFYLGMKIP